MKYDALAIKALEAKTATYEKEVAKALYDALTTMRADMSRLYDKFAVNGILTNADMSRYNRLANMEKQMLDTLDPALKANLKTIRRLTPEMYKESFYRYEWALDNETGLRLIMGLPNKDAITNNLDNTFDKIALETYGNDARLLIRKAISAGLAQGKTLPQMIKDMKKALNITNYVASRIIRTEAMTARNAGATDVYTRAIAKGVNGNVFWISVMDDRTRPTGKKAKGNHREMDGQARDKNGLFHLALTGETARYPGDSDLSAGQRIQCRCTIRFEIDGYSPQLMRTRENGVIPFQNYEEWYDGRFKVPDKVAI